MSDKKPLHILTAFGPSRDRAILLAVHPDERWTKTGPSPSARTYVLSLQGDQAVYREERPMPLWLSWYSNTSGVAYMTSVETNKLYKWQAGQWSEEVFCDTPVGWATYIFGIGGATPEEDHVFVASKRAVHIRTGGHWINKKIKTDETLYQIHGRSPTEVFFAAYDRILKWNGKTLEKLEAPDNDCASALWVTADDRLLSGEARMNMTDDQGNWDPMQAPFRRVHNVAELGGILYASLGDNGAGRVLPAPAARVLSGKAVDRLDSVGDGIVTYDYTEGRSLVTDGSSWRMIQVPLCEAGKHP